MPKRRQKMQITPEQIRAVRSGKAVRLKEQEVEVVVIRADVYDRMQDNDTVYTTAEMLDHVMAEDDADDPYLAELQKKYGGRMS
jgi:PHD/YefM family antitoxin component YafN of YafNO toxin-antitoxin module